MKRIFFIYIPGLSWREIITGVDNQILPNFDRLINQGTIGKTTQPSPCTQINAATSLITGTPAEKHCCVQPFEIDPIDSSLQEITRTSIKQPMLHELCDANGIPAALVNWPGSHNPYGQSKNPLVISDHFVKSCAFAQKFNHIPLESVSNDNLIKQLAELIFHVDEVDSDLLDFFSVTADFPEIDLFRQQLTTGITVHNVATYLLELKQHNLLCCNYDFLERFHRIGSLPQKSKIAAIRYLDMMLSSLLDYLSVDSESLIFIYSGGKDMQPGFFAAHGAGIKNDHLIDSVKTEQLAPTILDTFNAVCSQLESSPIRDIKQNDNVNVSIKHKSFLKPLSVNNTFQRTGATASGKMFLANNGLLIAESLKQQGKYRELVAHLEECGKNYNDPLLGLALVEALLLNQNLKEAKAIFLKLPPQTRHIEQGVVLALWIELENKQASEIVKRSTVSKSNALSANALRRLATLLVDHKRWAQALDILQHEDLNGIDSHRDYLKSVSLYYLKRYEEAEEMAKRAIKAKGTIGLYWLQLGKTYKAQKNLPKATNAFLNATKYDPRLYEAREYLKRIVGGA